MRRSRACSLQLDAHCAGAVAVRMRMYDTSVSLINCHLSSGQNEGDSLKRHSDCEEIARRALYPHDGQSADLDVSFTLDMSDKVRCALIDPSVLAVDISLCVLLLLCSLAKCSLICIALSHMQPSSISLAIGPQELESVLNETRPVQMERNRYCKAERSCSPEETWAMPAQPNHTVLITITSLVATNKISTRVCDMEYLPTKVGNHQLNDDQLPDGPHLPLLVVKG